MFRRFPSDPALAQDSICTARETVLTPLLTVLRLIRFTLKHCCRKQHNQQAGVHLIETDLLFKEVEPPLFAISRRIVLKRSPSIIITNLAFGAWIQVSRDEKLMQSIVLSLAM